MLLVILKSLVHLFDAFTMVVVFWSFGRLLAHKVSSNQQALLGYMSVAILGAISPYLYASGVPTVPIFFPLALYGIGGLVLDSERFFRVSLISRGLLLFGFLGLIALTVRFWVVPAIAWDDVGQWTAKALSYLQHGSFSLAGDMDHRNLHYPPIVPLVNAGLMFFSLSGLEVHLRTQALGWGLLLIWNLRKQPWAVFLLPVALFPERFMFFGCAGSDMITLFLGFVIMLWGLEGRRTWMAFAIILLGFTRPGPVYVLFPIGIILLGSRNYKSLMVLFFLALVTVIVDMSRALNPTIVRWDQIPEIVKSLGVVTKSAWAWLLVWICGACYLWKQRLYLLSGSTVVALVASWFLLVLIYASKFTAHEASYAASGVRYLLHNLGVVLGVLAFTTRKIHEK